MKPFFSILIPVYNKEVEICKCIQSLEEQTFNEFEIIIVNDGSTDNTKNVLADFCEKNNRIKIITHEKNNSLFVARYTAMKEASGEYVIFLDSDDKLESNACEKLYEFLKNKKVDILQFGLHSDDSNNTYTYIPKKTDDILRDVYNGSIYPAIWKNCYSIELIKRALPTIEPIYCNMGEDSYYSAILYSNYNSIDCIENQIYVYTVGNGMSRQKNNHTIEEIKKEAEDIENVGNHIMNYIEKYNPKYIELAKEHSRRMLKYVLYHNIFEEKDWVKIYRILKIFNVEKYDDIFIYGCDRLLEKKMSNDKGEKIDRINVLE